MILSERPRRLRKTGFIRDLVQETQLPPSCFVWPVFIEEGKGKKTPIPGLGGLHRYTVDLLIEDLKPLIDCGLTSVALFPKIAEALKDQTGQEALNPDGLVPQTLQTLHHHFPKLTLITDVALDPYSSDGHDGIVSDGEILNDPSVEVLVQQALLHARTGASFVAPSDMMDGRIGAIRNELDKKAFTQVGIISYCAKYASQFYGPFRQILDSAPKAGDKKSYQMNPANAREALREARLDSAEGADILMVKPALAYLDIVHRLKDHVDLPIAAYNVSGEYMMVKTLAQAGFANEQDLMLESLIAIRRAGADIIFSYFTPEFLKLKRKT